MLLLLQLISLLLLAGLALLMLEMDLVKVLEDENVDAAGEGVDDDIDDDCVARDDIEARTSGCDLI